MSVLAYDLCAGARGWEADNDDLEIQTIGFDIDADACATSRAAGLHAVQDDIARLVPAIVALVYGQPEGLIGSPPCQLFSAAGKGTGRQLMEELHRAVLDAARGASDVVMARHRRELRRLLYTFLRETEGVGAPDAKYTGRKRLRASRHRRRNGKPCGTESIPIRRGELRAEADRMARNVSLVWQPARWAARLRPRWIALEQVPAVLPLWEAMAQGLEANGYRCWTGVLSAERYGVPQTRKRAILLASLDGQPQPPEATHQAYVPGEPARAGEPDLFGPGLKPWCSMAEALGWGMTARPVVTITASNESGGPRPLDGGAHARAIVADARRAGDWLEDVDPEDIVVELRRGDGLVDRHGARRPRKGTEPSPTIRAGTGGGCGPNLTVKLVNGTHDHRAERAMSEPAPTLHFGERLNTVSFVTNQQPNATKRSSDEPAPTIKGGHDAADRQWLIDTGNTRGTGTFNERSDRNRPINEPAPGITSRADQLERRDLPPTVYDGRGQRDGRTGKFARPRSLDEPAPTIAGESRNDAWGHKRPATTVAGDPRVFPPGHKVNADDLEHGRGGQRRSGAGHTNGTARDAAVRVSVQEAAILQSFPPDWPWRGSRTSQFQQVGNAVPPGLARHVLAAAIAPTARVRDTRPATPRLGGTDV